MKSYKQLKQEFLYDVRQELKDGLAQCSPEQRMLFKRMYSHENLEAPMGDVVDAMPEGRLDWALQQVSRTLLTNAFDVPKELLE